MTTMEIKREVLEMDELEGVSGGSTWWLPFKKDADGNRHGWTSGSYGGKDLFKEQVINKPTATYQVEFDKYDIEYMEDFMTPEEIYEYFNC